MAEASPLDKKGPAGAGKVGKAAAREASTAGGCTRAGVTHARARLSRTTERLRGVRPPTRLFKVVMVLGRMVRTTAAARGTGASGAASCANPAARYSRAVSRVVRCRSAAAEEVKPTDDERFRLNNLSPFPGSKKVKKRIGRGYGAGQGGSAGKGMRGQNARSGGGVRPGFEGGQNPLYRRLPKLRGIAGGMGAGQPDYNVINVGLLSDRFAEGDEVTIEALAEKRILDLSGRKRSLPLKVLGDGDLDKKLTVKAVAFSKSAAEKIAAAGGEAVTIPGRKKWTRAEHEQKVKDQEAAAA